MTSYTFDRRHGHAAPPFMAVGDAVAHGAPYGDLAPSLQQQMTTAEYRLKLIYHAVAHVRGHDRLPDAVRTALPEKKYFELMVNIGLERLQLYPYRHMEKLVAYLGETPLSYYTTMLGELLKAERSYDTLPNFTAVDILSILGIGRNQYLDITKTVRGKLRWRVNRSFVRDHLPSELLSTTTLDPFWVMAVATKDVDVAKKLCKTGEELSLFKTLLLEANRQDHQQQQPTTSSIMSALRKLSAPAGQASTFSSMRTGGGAGWASEQGSPGNSASNRTAGAATAAYPDSPSPISNNPSFRTQASDGPSNSNYAAFGHYFACELPFAAVHALYHRGLIVPSFDVLPTECIVVPPLENFVMNRTSDDPQEMLLYRILATIDERTPLELLAQLLSADQDDICSAVAVYIRLGLAQRKQVAVPPFFLDAAPPSTGNLTAAEQPTAPSPVHSTWSATVQPLIAAAVADAQAVGSPGGNPTGSLGSPQSAAGGPSLASLQNRPQRRLALLFDASLTGCLMMTNLSSDPTFKQHAVTLFEAGKLTDEQLGVFLEKLEKCSLPSTDGAHGLTADDLFGGEAQKYISTVCCLRDSIKVLRSLCLADTELDPHEPQELLESERCPPQLADDRDRPSTPSSPDRLNRTAEAPLDPTTPATPAVPSIQDAMDGAVDDVMSISPVARHSDPSTSTTTAAAAAAAPASPPAVAPSASQQQHQRSVTPSKFARGVDLIKVEAINELEGRIRYMVLHRNYWAYFTVSPIAQAPLLHEAVENVYGSMVNIMPSTWLLLFLYSLIGSGPPCVLYPFGARVHKMNRLLLPKRGHSTKLRLLPLSMDAEPVEVSPQNALVILNEMTSTAPLFAMRLADTSRLLLADGTVTDGSPETFHVEVRVPFSASRAEALVLLQTAIARKRGVLDVASVVIAEDGRDPAVASGASPPLSFGEPSAELLQVGDALSPRASVMLPPCGAATSKPPAVGGPTIHPGGILSAFEAAVAALQVDCSVGNFNFSCQVTTVEHHNKRLQRKQSNRSSHTGLGGRVARTASSSDDPGAVPLPAVLHERTFSGGDVQPLSLQSSEVSGFMSPCNASSGVATPQALGGTKHFCVMAAHVIDIGFGLPLPSVDCCQMLLRHIPGLLTTAKMERHNQSTKWLSTVFGQFLELHSGLLAADRERIPLLSSLGFGASGGKRGPSTQQHLRTVGSELSGVPLPSKTVLFDGSTLISVDCDAIAVGEL